MTNTEALSEYHRELLSDVRREADVSGVMMVEAFFDRMAERLTESGELDTADRAFFQSGDGGQRLRVDGYSGDPRDAEGVLGLIVCDMADSDEVQTLGKSDLPGILNPLIRFLKKARTTEFRDSLNEVNPAFQLSDLIMTTWPHITKVKLVLMTNRVYVGREDSVGLTAVGDVPVTYSVWDLARFERFDRSGQAREDVVIELAHDFGGPLPVLKASQAGSSLESYLTIVPGEQLAKIYDKWGARLLEANVRSFLQARAKTNKGIIRTIREEPELFFPYNNGLSATCDAVDLLETSSGLALGSIKNLQIVNGAQTTGSIHSELKAGRDRLARVFVQMKLTVVPTERSESIIPRISEFANTQNKVNAADFFSNHPFHQEIERFSRRVTFMPREGERHDTKWFYERTRGQYLNERANRTAGQLKKFDLEYPKLQLFNKTDLAKFELSATGKPEIVSRGAQKCFAEFAKLLGAQWEKDKDQFNELWYKHLIAKAILFRSLEREVPRQPWYAAREGYRANIVTYAVAKVFHDAAERGSRIDLDIVWKRQSVPPALAGALLVAAAAAQDIIWSPVGGLRNLSEWAKKQACWTALSARTIDYGEDFEDSLVTAEILRASHRDARREAAVDSGINAQAEVVSRGSDFWRRVAEWGLVHRHLTPSQMEILRACLSLAARPPSEKQAKVALDVLARLRKKGFSE